MLLGLVTYLTQGCGKTGGLDQISNKDATILYCLANGITIDYAKLIWENIIHKLSKKTKEKVVPYPSFFYLHSESASRHDASTDSTTKADPGNSAPNDSMPAQQDESEEEEEEEVSKDNDTHAFFHDSQIDELEKKVKIEAEAEVSSPFATMVENTLGATTKDVPSADQATALPAKGEKNTNPTDAEPNLHDKLVDLLGIDVVTQYYNKKLLYDKYCDKMIKIKKRSKITNFDILTQKGLISLKVHREDGTSEVISNVKVSDLCLAEWREVVQACPDRKDKGWKTIYGLIKTRMEYLNQTKK
nr:hypothetical protein [Tanacetum cinerariifolium]